MKTAPTPGVLVAVMSPPRSRAFSRAIARPRPLPWPVRLRIGLELAIKHVRQSVGGDAGAIVCHRDQRVVVVSGDVHADAHPGVGNGVLDQVRDDSLQSPRVGREYHRLSVQSTESEQP